MISMYDATPADEMANLASALRGVMEENPDEPIFGEFAVILDRLIWETCAQILVFPGGRFGAPFFPHFDAYTYSEDTG